MYSRLGDDCDVEARTTNEVKPRNKQLDRVRGGANKENARMNGADGDGADDSNCSPLRSAAAAQQIVTPSNAHDCSTCQQDFSLFRRRNHCAHCGNSFCASTAATST